MMVALVDQSAIDETWPHIVDRIWDCAREQDTDCDPASLYVRCRGGAAFLIIAKDGEEIVGFSISAFDQWTRGTVLNILIMSGRKMMHWRDEMERMGIELAKFGGANRIVWKGREGWGRSQPMAKVVATVMAMEI